MTTEDCYFLGKITQTHGLKGEVILWLDVDEPDLYAEMDSVFLKFGKELVPYFIENIQIRGKKSIAKFEDIDTIEQTESIINKELFLPLYTLPELDDQTSFYYHEIIGFELKSENDGEILGTVSSVYEGSGQDLLAFEFKGKEVLVPISDDIVKTIDREKKQLSVDLPDGLIDLYME
ncbi:ribosome maturation factor RimM [Jiulongibacter sediminis]|uniref:Ribosome maturation factor RimM n=1 Tax=Jiulongibacter sediminis TaxID=1605367 RepID=A0A0P7C4H7_9BACT|nr:ribosome maturation factor RimM [Jiulongibacter sediminis]KPM49576.1 ribosome maturation factor RimM [Jiulongibacter sediminis]TBX26615.1 ribosome maturation factor RimM [Jiulongibacter sediminis]